MVRHDQQLGRVGEGRVAGKPGRIGVAVRADDRESFHLGEKRAGDGAGALLGGEQPIGVEDERGHASCSARTGS